MGMIGCVYVAILMMMTVQHVLMLMQAAKVLEVVKGEMVGKDS